MSVNVIDTIKPKNGGSFPVVEAVDVKVSDSQRLDAALAAKANTSDLSALSTAIAGKADKTDITELRVAVGTKAYQSSLDATNAVVATKAAQTSLDALSVIVDRKADKRDYDNIYAAIDQKASKTELNTAILNVEDKMERADTNLQNQINQIEISASAEAVVAPEVAAARVDSNGVSYPTLKDHLDATETDLNGKIADFDGLLTTGFNLLNPDKITKNKILLATGEETSFTGVFISDYMPVIEGYEYTINRPIGSPTYSTLIYFDDNKEVIGSSDGSATTFTMPADCAYVRANGTLEYIEQAMFALSYVSGSSAYKKIPNSLAAVKYQLWSPSPIYFLGDKLKSSGSIYLMTPDGTSAIYYGTEVNVTGEGVYLYWNSVDNTFVASNNYLVSDNVYFITFLSYFSFDNHLSFTSITSEVIPFKFDFIANKLYVNFASTGYLFNDGDLITIPNGYTQELSITAHAVICYDLVDSVFVSKTYTDVKFNGKSRYIILCIRNQNAVIGNISYETIVNAKANKNCMCYGDSLTWYDGHAFTWGPHQGEMCVGFESYLRSYLGMHVTNCGNSGETTPQICARLAGDESPAEADYILVMGGDNDDRLGVSAGTVLPPGSNFDRTTVAGALQYAIETTLTKNPDARIILMTEPIGWTYRDNAMERVDDVYPNTYRNVAKLYGLPLIDNWYESGINESNNSKYMIDPTVAAGNVLYIYHPSNEAWERIGKQICEELKKY